MVEFELDELPTVAPAGAKEAHHKTFGFTRRVQAVPVGLPFQFGAAPQAAPNVLVARKKGQPRPAASLVSLHCPASRPNPLV